MADLDIGTHHLDASDDGHYEYNRVRFRTLGKTEASFKPVMDPAGRMVKYVTHEVSWAGYITMNDLPADADDVPFTADETMEDVKLRLLAPQGHLIIREKGMADIEVNAPGGSVRDVANGPLPQLMTWVSVGGAQAVKVTFKVTFCIPLCEGSKYKDRPLALTYKIDRTIDSDGYTTVRYTGTLEIAMTPRPNHTIDDTADAYLERVRPELLQGFRREQNYTLSEDKRTLTFTITDTQVPVPLVGGASYCDLRETVRSKPDTGFRTAFVSLSGSIRMPAGSPRSAAARVFLRVAGARIDVGVQEFARRGGSWFRPDLFGMVMITDYSATEELFGKDSQFSMTWMLFGTTLEGLLVESGLWRPIPGSSFASWRADMINSAARQRGHAGLRHSPQDEGTLVDLCTRPPQRLGGGQVRVNPPRTPWAVNPIFTRDPAAPWPFNPSFTDDGSSLDFREGLLGGSIQFQAGPTGNSSTVPIGFSGIGGARERDSDPRLPPDNTWIEYESHLAYEQIDAVAVHKPIGVAPQEAPLQFPVTGGAQPVGRIVIPPTPPDRVPAAQGNVVQEVGGPSQTVWLTGRAMRANYEIQPPRLVRCGGVPVAQSYYFFDQVVVAKSGVRIFEAMWRIGYVLARPPATLPVLANPLLGTSGHE